MSLFPFYEAQRVHLEREGPDLTALLTPACKADGLDDAGFVGLRGVVIWGSSKDYKIRRCQKSP